MLVKFNMNKLKEDILATGYNENDKDWLINYNDLDGQAYISVLKAFTIVEECEGYKNLGCDKETLITCDKACVKKENNRCYEGICYFYMMNYIETDIPNLFK